ncbi:MAG: glycerol kinase GlpK [Bacillales bacterium]
MKYILTIDQGTTSTRSSLFNKKGELVSNYQQEINCMFLENGYVEQDAMEIWLSVINSVNNLLQRYNISYNDIDCIGITNQRETIVAWDKDNGMPVYNAIVWQSRQTAYICDRWKPYKDLIHQKTGLILNPYFSASKIAYILENVKNAKQKLNENKLLIGTIDTWLMYKLSNGKIFKTDVTNASRTMLFNINKMQWDDELLNLFNIPKNILPKVCPSDYEFGAASYFSKKLKITGVAGDQQASLFGHRCFSKGDLKNTYGTGCFMLMNIGEKPILSKNGLITTIAFSFQNKIYYALEGSVFIGGAIIQWLKKGLKVIDNERETGDISIKTTEDDIYFVPAFVGLGCPYWDNEVRGSIFGISRGTTKEHIIKASLNSIALQSKDLVKTILKDTNIKLNKLKVDGGASANDYLMQYQSNILNCEVIVPDCKEITSLGVAYIAGLKNNYWTNIEEILSINESNKIYKPNFTDNKIKIIDEKWRKAIEASRIFK